MAATVSTSKVEQVVLAAVVGALVVALPEVANIVSDGYQASDVHALEVVGGGALAAALRSLALYLPAFGKQA